MSLDAMIPIRYRDRAIARLAVRSIRRFVEGVRRIYVVSAEDPCIDDTYFVNETAFPFSIEDVRRILDVEDRAGWYLQQLIKLYFPIVETGCLEHVFVVDADTIFLRPVRFIEDGRVVFSVSDQFHQPYFDHMQRMHPMLAKVTPYSGIAHCMIFTKQWLTELMKLVEEHHKQTPFWRSFLYAVDPKYRELSGASEYEIYLNFCLDRHAEELLVKRFNWQNATRLSDVRPRKYDYVSFHWYNRDANIDYEQLSRLIFSKSSILRWGFRVI